MPNTGMLSIDSPWVKSTTLPWQVFIGEGQRHLYRAREIIYTQDQISHGIYYLHRGRVKISILCRDGSEKILAIHDAPATFGESAAFDGQPYFATAMALENSEVYLIPYSKLLELLQHHPETMLLLFKSLCRKMRLLALQVEGLTFLSASARVAHMLIKLSTDYGRQTQEGLTIQLPITHQELANVIGTSRTTVTMILNRLANNGIIKNHHRRFIICNLEYLRQITREKNDIF